MMLLTILTAAVAVSAASDALYVSVKNPPPAKCEQTQKHDHCLVSVLKFGEAIELEDGSSWTLSPQDSYKTLSWNQGDLLLITPNRNWFFFGNYFYCITNQRNGSYIHANLSTPPVSYGPYTHWITGLDRFSGHLFAEDGQRWTVAHADWGLLYQWDINDFLIIGLNDEWLSSHDHILINVSKKQHIRVKSV